MTVFHCKVVFGYVFLVEGWKIHRILAIEQFVYLFFCLLFEGFNGEICGHVWIITLSSLQGYMRSDGVSKYTDAGEGTTWCIVFLH